MTARVLIVDDLLANLKLIEARLSAEYFEVLTATNGADALALCASGKCDIVLLDVMMPGMDGLEVCRRLKGNKATAHIPVVMVTALDQPSSLLHGFEAGADDFLAKPIDELALLARVKSLSRSRFALDELRSQALRSVNLGIGFPLSRAMASDGSGGRIMVAEDSPASAELIANALRRFHDVECIHDQDRVLDSAALGNYDLFIVSLDLTGYDGLRFCTRLRSMERTRQIPVLAIADPKDRQRILRGFDLGVNDYVPRPVDPGELAARARAQIRRKRHADDLRQTVEASLEMAAADPLTGLRNRRYLETHLGALLGQTRRDRLPLCVIILDLDDFKAVNDRHGHGAGDQVLQTFAARAKAIIRGTGTLCRLGGDEFVIIMPGTSLHTGFGIAEEIRAATASETFTLTPGGHEIPVTVSAGLAESANDSQSGLLRRADMALYRSKQGGRDRVCVDCAGAAVQARMAGCL
jgi:two-component system, cell cycle response regulator